MPDYSLPSNHVNIHTFNQTNDGRVIAIVGTIDMLTAPYVLDAILAVRDSSPNYVIIDLSKVAFLASAGMTMLLDAREKMGPETGFSITANNTVLRPMKIVGLDTRLPMYPTLDEALAVHRQV